LTIFYAVAYGTADADVSTILESHGRGGTTWRWRPDPGCRHFVV